MKPNLHQYLTSKRLVNYAVVLWVLSLVLTGFNVYHKQQHILGYSILLTGWFGIFGGNLAWLANVFFLYAAIQLKSDKSPVASPILAVVLSFDTFLVDFYPLNEGGWETAIYGYGWGAFLWFLSLFLLLVAAGEQQIEQTILHKLDKSVGEYWLRPLGLVCFMFAIILAAYFSVHDHIIANPAERQYLKGILFKHGKICGAQAPVVSNPLTSFRGPLSIVLNQSIPHAVYLYPFNETKNLLEWGIPSIRIANRDYFLKNGQVISVPAEGGSHITLYVTEYTDEHGHPGNIRAKLVDTDSGRIIFDQRWEREPYGKNTYIYCPNYSGSPRRDEQPRKILMEALNIENINSLKSTRNQRIAIQSLTVRIISTTEGGETARDEFERIANEVPFSNKRLRYHKLSNIGCPPGIGWDGLSANPSQNIGWPFKIQDKSYYPGKRNAYDAICVGNHVYLYTGSSAGGIYYLNISKRDLSDFRKSWGYIFVLPKSLETKRDNILKVKDVHDNGSSATLELVNKDTGKIINISVDF